MAGTISECFSFVLPWLAYPLEDECVHANQRSFKEGETLGTQIDYLP